MSADPDRELVLRCQTVGTEGFESAFSELYQKYKDKVYGIALRITGNRSDALDAAQEAFVLLYQNVASFQFDSKFSSWLYRLVVNASIDHVRRVRKRRRRSQVTTEPVLSDSLEVVDESAPDPVGFAESSELSDRIQAAILRLSMKLRIVTVLRYQQNLSYDELAETLDISLGTVKSRLARAHLALAEHLEPLIETSQSETGRDGEDPPLPRGT